MLKFFTTTLYSNFTLKCFFIFKIILFYFVDVKRAEVLFANFIAELIAFCAAIPYFLLFVEISKIDINI